MNRLEETQLYHDAGGLDKLRQAGQQNDEAALRKAAEHFESIFMNMLLKSMRKANDVMADENSPFNSQSTKFYRDMQDDQLAMDLSSSGALGLADIIVDQWSPEKGKNMPADVLRQDGFSVNQQTNPFANKTDGEFKNQPLAALQIQSQTMEKQVLTMADEKLAQQQKQPQEQQVSQSEKTAKPSDMFTSKQDFVEKLLPYAERAAEKLGMPAVAMIAQAALETGWGQKMMTKQDGSNAYNFFGIKADDRWKGESTSKLTQEFKFGQMQTEQAQFRAYKDIGSGLDDYADFIKSQPRYQQAIESAKEPENYFNQLQKAGYATDPNYSQKILSILKDQVFSQLGAKSQRY